MASQTISTGAAIVIVMGMENCRRSNILMHGFQINDDAIVNDANIKKHLKERSSLQIRIAGSIKTDVSRASRQNYLR